MTKQIHRLLKFGEFIIDPNERMLRHRGEIVSLSPKVFDMLYLFATHPGTLLDKETLMSELWGDHFVEESNLSYSLSVLRKALSEHDPSQKYIETFPKRGYRFLAEVTTVDPVAHEVIAAAPVHNVVSAAIHQTEENPTPNRALVFRKYWRIGVITAGLGLLSGAIWIGTLRKDNSGHKIESSVAPPPTEVAAVKSIAVLPFRKLTPHDGDDYLGVGIADTLINRLSNVPELQVRPTSAILSYAQSSQDALSAGREQKVDAVMEGTVQHVGQQLRVGVRLLRVSDGTVFWSDTYNFAWKDLFTTQDAIADQLAKTLAVKMSWNEQAKQSKPLTKNPAALQAYLKARYIYNSFDQQTFGTSLKYFQEAIAKDAEFAAAYEGLAATWLRLGYRAEYPPKEAWEKARTAANKALELDPTMAAAYSVLGFIERDIVTSENYIRCALELDPNNYEAHLNVATNHIARGKFAEAMTSLQKARELNPISIEASSMVAWLHFYWRQFEKAIEQAQQILEVAPHYTFARIIKADALVQLGRCEEAIKEYTLAFQLTPETLKLDDQVAAANASAGRHTEAKKTLAHLQAEAKTSYVPSFNLARICIALGDKQQALTYLTKAHEEEAGEMKFIGVDPRFQSLRNEPRFQAILREMNLNMEQ